MKNLLLLILLVPTVLFSQVSSWRNSPPSNSSSTTSGGSSSKTNSVSENNVSTWRNSSPTEFNRPRTNSFNNVIVHDPWIGGWNRWQPPLFGWNSYNPYWYWNDFGYRQPARVYYYDNGKTDTIKGKKPIYNFGVQHTTNSQMGTFFAVGNKVYFIFDFNTTYKRDRSTFFPNGTLALVDFPIIGERVRQNNFNFGIGRRFSRTGVHMMVGAAKERVMYLGKDDVGEITFPKSSQSFVTFKFGALHDYKGLTIKMDYDPVVQYGQFGVGFNF
jgi:hypothetical protein